MKKIYNLLNCLSSLPIPINKAEGTYVKKAEKGYCITTEPVTLFLGPDIETSITALKKLSSTLWVAIAEEKTRQEIMENKNGIVIIPVTMQEKILRLLVYAPDHNPVYVKIATETTIPELTGMEWDWITYPTKLAYKRQEVNNA